MTSSLVLPTAEDILKAKPLVQKYVTPVPLFRSYALESVLNLKKDRRVWIKDYGWTPVGSFKLLGALNWMANHLPVRGDRTIVAHSSGNFASGIAFAGMCFSKKVKVVMPETAPTVKFERTRSFGAEILTYDLATDHLTKQRDTLTRQLAEKEGALQASPYDDPHVIAGNGVGGLEIVEELKETSRNLSHFICPVSGGGLMAGHALAIHHAFPNSKIIGVEPTGADDFFQSMAAGNRIRIQQPKSICDGLCSYEVGEYNWPILLDHISRTTRITDMQTRVAMRWLYEHHGLRSEPSGAISVAVALTEGHEFDGDGDIVIIVSGRNVDDSAFQRWIEY